VLYPEKKGIEYLQKSPEERIKYVIETAKSLGVPDIMTPALLAQVRQIESAILIGETIGGFGDEQNIHFNAV